MLYKISQIISTLFLLNLGVCLAMETELIPAPPDMKGIRLKSAKCEGRYYYKTYIYNAVDEGMRLLRIGGDETKADLLYEHKTATKLPFKGPYFLEFIATDRPFPDNQVDYVVFTASGKLANVVSSIRSERDGEWRFKDCELNYETIPRRRSTRHHK